MAIRLVVVDDHEMVRRGLCSLLAGEDGIEVVAEADDGQAALAAVDRHRPDVVLMDVQMPTMGGSAATRKLAEAVPDSRILALSMHADRRFVTEMLRAGARGYLLKSCRIAEMLRAIHTVVEGGVYIAAEVAGGVLEDLQTASPAPDGPASGLTEREHRVLQLIAEGKATKQIALILEVSARTVDADRQHIMDKLGLFSIAELTKYAIAQGMTPLMP